MEQLEHGHNVTFYASKERLQLIENHKVKHGKNGTPLTRNAVMRDMVDFAEEHGFFEGRKKQHKEGK